MLIGKREYFEPEAIVAMSRAFDEACIALRVTVGDQHHREVIATRIIYLAGNGVVKAVALRDRVLLESRSFA